jgi:hypothetical protein
VTLWGPCFVCGNEGTCAHREIELVQWWAQLTDQRRSVSAMLCREEQRPVPAVARPAEVVILPEPVVVAPAERKKGRYAVAYSGMRGW